MGKDISDLQNIKADSKEDINQQLIEMDAAAAREQNKRMRDAEKARAASIKQGVSGVTQALGSAADLVPLYGKNAADRRGEGLAKDYAHLKPKGMSDAEWAGQLAKATTGTRRDFEFEDSVNSVMENMSGYNFNNIFD